MEFVQPVETFIKTEARAVVTPARAGDYARVCGVDVICGPQGF